MERSRREQGSSKERFPRFDVLGERRERRQQVGVAAGREELARLGHLLSQHEARALVGCAERDTGHGAHEPLGRLTRERAVRSLPPTFDKARIALSGA